MSQDDLAAVREFRAALDEPRDGALVRGRRQLARADAASWKERPRPRRSWVLATSGAALAVAVVVGGAATVYRSGPQRDQPVAGQPGPAQSPPTSAVDLPVTVGTKAPLNPPVTGTAGANHARAVEALTRLAARQTGGPLAIGAGQVLYVKTYSLTGGEHRYIHEVWRDVTTGAVLRIRRQEESAGLSDNRSSQAEIDAVTANAQSNPPGLDNLNGAYVAAFPAGPGRAQQLASAWKDWARQEYPGRDADTLIFKQLYEVFHYVEPLLNPAQRSTLYLALIELPSVKAGTATIAGRQYDVVCVPGEGQGAQCLLFDQDSGRYTGDAGPGTDLVVKAGGFEFVDVGVQPRPAVGPDVVASEKQQKVSGSTPTPKR